MHFENGIIEGEKASFVNTSRCFVFALIMIFKTCFFFLIVSLKVPIQAWYVCSLSPTFSMLPSLMVSLLDEAHILICSVSTNEQQFLLLQLIKRLLKETRLFKGV